MEGVEKGTCTSCIPARGPSRGRQTPESPGPHPPYPPFDRSCENRQKDYIRTKTNTNTNKTQTPKAPKSKSPCPPLRIIPLMTTPPLHLAFGLEIVGENMSSSDQYSFVQIWSSQITGLSFKKLSN